MVIESVMVVRWNTVQGTSDNQGLIAAIEKTGPEKSNAKANERFSKDLLEEHMISDSKSKNLARKTSRI